MGKKDRAPLTPEDDPQDLGTDPNESIARAVMTDRLRRQRGIYEGQLAAMGATVDTLTEQLAAKETELAESTEALETATTELQTAKDSAEQLATETALGTDLATASAGKELDPAVRDTIISRYSNIEGDKPAFSEFLKTDVVARSLLGAKAPVKQKEKPALPGSNNGDNSAIVDPAGTDISDDDIANMSTEQLKANEARIFGGDFTLTE